MPLIQRSSGNIGRNLQPGMPERERQMAKLKEDNERLRTLYEDANKRLAEANKSIGELTSTYQRLKKQNADLIFENASWETKHTELKARYENLELRHNALKDPSPTNPMASPLPDRTKRNSLKPSKTGESRDNREHQDRKLQDREHGEARETKEHKSDRGRLRGGDRDDRHLRERLGDRRPPTTNRHIEGWGPSAGPSSGSNKRSSSATPSAKIYTSATTGRNREVTYTATGPTAFSRVPRTAHPMSPVSSGFPSSSGSSSTVYDDDNYEDGNYHAYPVSPR